MATLDQAKVVLTSDVKALPDSVKLWMQVAKLEQNNVNKSRVLRRALEHIMDFVKLLKVVVELANEEDARILISRSTE